MSGFASYARDNQDEEMDLVPRYIPTGSSTGRRRHSPPPPPLDPMAHIPKFSDFTVSRAVSSAFGTGTGGNAKKWISSSLPDEHKHMADLMQIKCEDSILFMFHGVKVVKYWTDYPKSLAIVVAVPEVQFSREFQSQFGSDAFKLFLAEIKSLPFNFPLVPASKVDPDSFPADHVPVKLRLSANMLKRFQERGGETDKPTYKFNAVWDLYVGISVYHASDNIPVPGFSFRLLRAEERPAR